MNDCLLAIKAIKIILWRKRRSVSFKMIRMRALPPAATDIQADMDDIRDRQDKHEKLVDQIWIRC
jgi:hypothetical protein